MVSPDIFILRVPQASRSFFFFLFCWLFASFWSLCWLVQACLSHSWRTGNPQFSSVSCIRWFCLVSRTFLYLPFSSYRHFLYFSSNFANLFRRDERTGCKPIVGVCSLSKYSLRLKKQVILKILGQINKKVKWSCLPLFIIHSANWFLHAHRISK